MRQFGDAARIASLTEEDQSDEPNVEFKLLDREVSLKYPGSGALAYLTATMSTVSDNLSAVGIVINFVVSCMEPEDARYLNQILLDSQSGFDVEDISELAEFLLEEWSGGNPTSGSSGSSRQGRTSGKSSTANSRRPASPRSSSRSGGSAT
jgi:hypothetical protein